MEYQFDRKVPPSFSIGKFLYEPKHPSCYGPDQDREHDKPNSIWNRPNQGVFRVRVYVHTTAIARHEHIFYRVYHNPTKPKFTIRPKQSQANPIPKILPSKTLPRRYAPGKRLGYIELVFSRLCGILLFKDIYGSDGRGIRVARTLQIAKRSGRSQVDTRLVARGRRLALSFAFFRVRVPFH